jgi:uncharacterized protein
MRRSKRIRKKLHLGEFQELGFKLSFHFSPDLPTDERNQLIENFIHEAIEANGLQFGGGGSQNSWDGFVTLDAKRGSATELHREKVGEWLKANPKILEYEVGALTDAWYE